MWCVKVVVGIVVKHKMVNLTYEQAWRLAWSLQKRGYDARVCGQKP